MRVALVCNEYPPSRHGGLGSLVQTLARGLAARGHEVRVVGCGGGPAEERDGPVAVTRLPRTRLPGLGWLLNRWRVRSWLARAAGALDVVEVPDFEGWLPWRVPGVTAVVRLHQSYTALAAADGARPPAGVRWLERRTLASHRAWIAVSREASRVAQATFGLRPALEAVVPSPLPPPAAVAAPALPWEGPFVLFAGSLSERKGVLDLAEAAARFLAARPEAALVYAGGEAPGSPVREAIRARLGPLAARAFFTGPLPREQARALMARATVFAFPSRLESFGLAVAEAMGEGCPVVVPDAPPFDELVDHGRTGLRFAPRDPAALAAAVSRLLADPALAARLGRAGRAHVEERHCEEAAVTQTLAFYRRAIAAAGRRAPEAA